MPIFVTIRALRVDIITFDCDAIINAANSSLLDGDDVDGTIHCAVGPELLEARHALHGCYTGEAKLTPSFRLPARYVIHTVGPIWHDGRQDEVALLAVCYRNSLELARKHEVRSIVFPCISTGVYGFPPQLVVPTAVRVAREHGVGLDAITFCCLPATHLAPYKAVLASDK